MSRFIIKAVGNSLNLLSYLSVNQASKIALKLFSTPQKGRINPNTNPFLQTAKQSTISYSTLSIKTYYWPGNRDTILLAHGWESNTSRWEALVVQLLAQNYAVVALDAPAHGASSGQLFNALLYANCIHEVYKKYRPNSIIGHSVGGMASAFFKYFHKAPEIKKLILLGAPAHFRGVFNRYIELLGYNTRINKGLDQLVLKRYNHTPDYYSVANFAKTISEKTLIVHDKNDSIIPFSDGKLLFKSFNNAKFFCTQGLGHGLQDAAVFSEILKFLN